MRNDLVEVRSSVPVRKFVPVYHDMLRAKMTCEEKLIYIILKSFVSFGCEEGEVYPSMDTICAMSGMSRPRATRVINKLVKNGYVKKLRRGVTKPNLYTVADYPAMWEEKTTVEDRKEILDTEIPYKTDQLLDELVRRGVLTEEQLAVEAGYWHNFRFNPAAKAEGKPAFTLDSKAPTGDLMEFLDGEVRYNSLKRANPERAEKLFAKNAAYNKERYEYLNKLITLYGGEQ